jgi:hypothetical protein
MTELQWQQFVDHGIIELSMLEQIASSIKQGLNLTERQIAVYQAVPQQVEALLNL